MEIQSGIFRVMDNNPKNKGKEGKNKECLKFNSQEPRSAE